MFTQSIGRTLNQILAHETIPVSNAKYLVSQNSSCLWETKSQADWKPSWLEVTFETNEWTDVRDSKLFETPTARIPLPGNTLRKPIRVQTENSEISVVKEQFHWEYENLRKPVRITSDTSVELFARSQSETNYVDYGRNADRKLILFSHKVRRQK